MLIKRIQGRAEKCNGYYYEFDMHSKPLGEGGMGVVYKGYKIYEATGDRRVVAIKAMHVDLPAEVYGRAEREASIRLRNDNLVEMLGFISEIEIDSYGMQRNRYYVVSEYLNGVVLSDLLKGHFKDKDGIEITFAKQLYTDYVSKRESTSIAILKCVLSGILALHDNGYIHRDIDPSNIMVTDNGTIKLIDFGIAKYVRSLGSLDKSLTSTGKFIGKVEYASPELMLGDVRNQGYQTDIYAIGILFYQLLVGKLPFTGSIYDVSQMQLSKKVPVKNIEDPLLRKIVRKATEKKIPDRYSSVAELRVDIDKAENTTRSVVGRYWKHIVVTVLSSVACIGIILFMIDPKCKNSSEEETAYIVVDNDDKVQKDTIVVEVDDYLEDFKDALAKLDSKDKQTATDGLTLMKQLAEKNHVEAQKELGLTYSIYGKAQPPSVKNRRKVLGLHRDSSIDLSIEYLENIKSDQGVSADALYVLGYNYWWKQDYKKGEEVLSKAQKVLSESGQTNYNGYSRSDLEGKIKRYLSLCKEQLRGK